MERQQQRKRRQLRTERVAVRRSKTHMRVAKRVRKEDGKTRKSGDAEILHGGPTGSARIAGRPPPAIAVAPQPALCEVGRPRGR